MAYINRAIEDTLKNRFETAKLNVRKCVSNVIQYFWGW